VATTREVYLFAVKRHSYQIPNDKRLFSATPEAREELSNSIEIAISQHGIAGIAEEMSLEALRKRSDADESVLRRLASKMCLPYRLCDLNPHAPDHERELIWTCELTKFNIFPVLFVLGADHVESFERLLSKSGFLPFIIVRDWKAPSDQSEAI
jgi:hypothetical protein